MSYNVLAVVFIIAVIVVAQLFVPGVYDWTNNTISELASQGYGNRWIMQLGFIGFGVLLSIGVIANLRGDSKFWYRDVPLLAYALSILLTGILSEKPFIEGIPYSDLEARLHSIFAMIAGIGLSIAILVSGMIDESMFRKIAHFCAFIFVIGMSITFGGSSSGIGIIQRIMYLGSFAWIVFLYDTS